MVGAIAASGAADILMQSDNTIRNQDYVPPGSNPGHPNNPWPTFEFRRTRAVSYAFEEFNTDPITRGDNAYVAALYASPFCQALAVAPVPPNLNGPANCQAGIAFYKPFSTSATSTTSAER